MRILTGEIEVFYEGRGNTHLPKAKRLVIIKPDNSVIIHKGKGIKPLNYMSSSKSFEENDFEGEKHFLFTSKKECLHIVFYGKEIVDFNANVPEETPGLTRYGTEKEIQEKVFCNIESFLPFLKGKEFECIKEFQTGDGPVDILVKSQKSIHVIEIKRVATMNAMQQVQRYTQAIKEKEEYKEYDVIPYVLAKEIKNTALKLAERRKIEIINFK